MNNRTWKLNDKKFPQTGSISELAVIFEQARKLAPLHLLTVSETILTTKDTCTIFSCNWKNKNMQLHMMVTFSGNWHRSILMTLPMYFFNGTFNGEEGFGHVQGWKINELAITLSGTVKNNSFKDFIYFLESKK
jgi:hypothetical protein